MAGNMVTRRALLGSAVLAACGPQRAARYDGWLFVASTAETGIAVADLAEFRRVMSIPLPSAPRHILRAGERVFATCPDAHLIAGIDPVKLVPRERISVPGPITALAATPDGQRLAAIIENPAVLELIDPSNRKTASVALPGTPAGLDVTNSMVAVTTHNGNVVRVSVNTGIILGVTPLGARANLVRFRKDGKTILAGASDQPQIMTIDASTGQLVARLPLAFLPRRFCFNDDGGQMFVSGTGEDSIIIVSPYQSEVDQTMIAGQKPLGMAVALAQKRNLLFITNAGSADLTIFDIDARQMASSIHIGGKPGEVLTTPDGNYALVIDQASGDVSVVRVATALSHALPAAMAYGTRPLFTVFPTGPAPQSAAIIPKAG